MLLKKTTSRAAIAAFSAGLLASVSNSAVAADTSPADGWAGPYIGLSAGVEASRNTWNTTSVGLNNFVGVDPTSAHQKLDGTGARFGFFLGWDFPISPNLLVGVEGDFAGINDSKKTYTGIPGVDYNFPGMGITGVTSVDSVNATQKFDSSVRARLGYVVDPKVLVYGTAGVAFQETDFTVICPSSANTSSLCGVPESQTIGKPMVGWTVGAGADVKLGGPWSARLEYRYADFGGRTRNFFGSTNLGVDSVSAGTDSASHIVTFGVRYALGARSVRTVTASSSEAPMAPAPLATPAAAPSPAPQAEEKFLVFFDFDKSNLRTDAERIVARAAEYAKTNGKAVITATGHTDTMGTAAYNMALSERRAQAVRDALVKLGIPVGEISVRWKGKSEPLVQTGDGVKEPQNRRVEIVLE